ncbi:MAG: DUF1444 family protein [Phycisphaerales bacterium]|nr:DUF1444 family protein [Phycisphaerales bacterium]
MSTLPREPEAFCEAVAAMLRARFSTEAIETCGPLDVMIGARHLALGNLYRMVQCEPHRAEQVVQEFLSSLQEGDLVGELALPLSLARGRIMPRLQPESLFRRLDPDQVAHTEWVNGTVIVYVIDLPRVTVSITTEQIIRWGIDIEEIDLLARSNLSRYRPDLEVKLVESEDGGRAALMSARDGYDATRLLLEGFHERLAPQLRGDFLVATPARDVLVAMSADPEDFVDRIKRRINRDYRRLPYPITSDLFLVTRDGIAGTRAA